VSQPYCSLSLKQEQILVKQKTKVLQTVQLPHLDQILIFGQSQITTQAIRACLWRDIPILYLSRMGRCYGRVISVERGYRQLNRLQQSMGPDTRLAIAQTIIQAKLKNSRVILQRQHRRAPSSELETAIQGLEYLIQRTPLTQSTEILMGFEGAGAAAYFKAIGSVLSERGFGFETRSRRPPLDPVNALLSFGYQILWNHLLSLLEFQGLDPYEGCLHVGSDRHAALVSDLVEEFRAPIVDSLVLYLIHRGMIDATADFDFPEGACYLNETGRRKFLHSFIQRMEEPATSEGDQPRWNLLNQQVQRFRDAVLNPDQPYQPYLIR
jgi:CRISP-associated protein Cas1